MNRILKRKLIASVICITIGILCIILPIFANNLITESLNSYLNGFASGIIVVGVYTLIITIRAMKSESERKKLENIINDERLNSINNIAMSITFKISLLLEAIVSIVSAFLNNMIISEYFGFAICIQLVIYLILYQFVKKSN